MDRLIPVIRTFAPFVAGVGSMPYRKLLCSNVVGGLAWVAGLVLLGCFVGNVPAVKQRLGIVMPAVGIVIPAVIVSVMPAVIGYWRHNAGATGGR